MIDLRTWPLEKITPESIRVFLKDFTPQEDIVVTPDQHRHLFTQLEQQKALRATHSEHYETAIALGIEGHVVYVSDKNTTPEIEITKTIENSVDVENQERIDDATSD